MPGSTLTVRTLALATVALVLACGHAVKAMGDQRVAADRAITRVAPSVSPIRVVPAGSGHSTVATFSNTGRGGTSSSSKVATFTSQSGSASHSVVTFGGDRIQRSATVASNSRQQQPSPRAKVKGGILPPRGEPPVIAVRRNSPPQPPAEAISTPPVVGPPAPEPVKLSAAGKPKPALRNAFGGLSSARASVEQSGGGPLVYAHASQR